MRFPRFVTLSDGRELVVLRWPRAYGDVLRCDGEPPRAADAVEAGYHLLLVRLDAFLEQQRTRSV